MTRVELTFANTENRNICESERHAINAFGIENARLLKALIAAIDDAPTLADFPFDFCYCDESETLIISIPARIKITCGIPQASVPKKIDDELAHDLVYRLKVLGIEQHG